MNPSCCTSPLGVAGLPWWFHAAVLAALVALGLVTFVLVGLIVDSQATRHMLMHWLRRSERCGRCNDQQTARRNDQDFLKAPGGLTPLARSMHGEEENPRG